MRRILYLALLASSVLLVGCASDAPEEADVQPVTYETGFEAETYEVGFERDREFERDRYEDEFEIEVEGHEQD